jgi:hypothetical protein
MSMPVLSESERLRLLTEGRVRYVARGKVRDCSEMTNIIQAKASKTAAPQIVSTVVDLRGDCATKTTVAGKGTNMEYLGILQKAQGCAVCANPDVATNLGIYLSTGCVNQQAPPFTQQNLSTMYTTPCTVPGYNVYFPAPIHDGSNCTFNRITTPSAN